MSQEKQRRGNDKEKRRLQPNKEKGKGGGCRHLTSSDQNSKADQVDMKFASNKSTPLLTSSLMPQFSLPLGLLSSFPVPHANIFFSHLLQPQPHLSISLKAMRSSLPVCFLHPSFPLYSFARPLSQHTPPLPLHTQGPLLPLSAQLMKGGINEGVHVNLWWPLLTSFNGAWYHGPNHSTYRDRYHKQEFSQGERSEMTSWHHPLISPQSTVYCNFLCVFNCSGSEKASVFPGGLENLEY